MLLMSLVDGGFPNIVWQKMINLGERNVTECAKMHRYETVFLLLCVNVFSYLIVIWKKRRRKSINGRKLEQKLLFELLLYKSS